jgi:arylsulfatase A-like enzyme
MIHSRCLIWGILISILVMGCQETRERPPNILWIFVEDISPDLGCYGNELANTPFLDQMASEGIMFTNAITPAPVCSAARSALITGVMQTTLGLHNHHSSRTEASAIHLPDSIATLPELLKEADYFTFNHGKDDYNFWYNREDLYAGSYRKHSLYGNSGLAIDWNDRDDPDQPFFGQIQLKGGKHIFNEAFEDKLQGPTVDRTKISLPPYYVNDSIFIEEWARYLDTHQITDREVQDIITRLEEDGLLENTVVFFFADHGMRGLRHKQFLYEGGLQVPFIMVGYGSQSQIPKGKIHSELVNLLDISATTLSLADVPLPDYLDGKDLLAPDYQPHEYIVSARDRCDFTIDRIRSVRSPRYKYIRNFLTDRPALQPNYRDEWESTKYFRKMFEDGTLTPVQARHALQQRPSEELYDLEADPWEINNLADSSYASDILEVHRSILNQWIDASGDQGQFPESEEGLKYMLGIWGDQAINPEYDRIRDKYPELAGSLRAKRFEAFETIHDQ